MLNYPVSPRSANNSYGEPTNQRWLVVALITIVAGLLPLALYSLLNLQSSPVAAQPQTTTTVHSNSYQFGREGSSPTSRTTATTGLVTEDLSSLELTPTDLAMILVWACLMKKVLFMV